MLRYALSYRGLGVGVYELRANPVEGGYRFSGRLLSSSLARWLGFDLALASETGRGLATRRFEKRLVAPGVGEVRLVARVEEALLAERYENGRLAGRYRAKAGAVFDDLSLVYHMRVRPEPGTVAFLGLYGLVRGPVEARGEREVRVPAGRFRARVFVFDRPEAFFEIALSGANRLPVFIRFGFGRERLLAELVADPAQAGH